jgi:cytidylate kinase
MIEDRLKSLEKAVERLESEISRLVNTINVEFNNDIVIEDLCINSEKHDYQIDHNSSALTNMCKKCGKIKPEYYSTDDFKITSFVT